jgi:hypothetical protein
MPICRGNMCSVSRGANDAAGVYFGSFSRPREWFTRLGFNF